jgi:hypothetical protein
MVAPSPAGLVSPAIPELPVQRFTVEQYHRMIDAGILQGRVELLEGWIVPKMGKNPPHVITLRKLVRLIESVLPPGWQVRQQDPITTLESEPEPDLALVRGTDEDYLTRHPFPVDVALLAEVADSTLTKDQGVKARLYARAAIPGYWIVNHVDNQLEVYTDPTGPDSAPQYRQQQIYGVNDAVPLVIDGQIVAQLPVRDILP